MIRSVHILLLAASCSIATDARADDAEADAQPTIIVTGYSDGYRTVETTSGTKTNTPILDVPQAISVITAAQIADQSIRSMADLVRMIPGISAGQGEGHRDQITLRGNNSTADFFVDGLRDDVQYFRSFYNIDRVEAHKGPNAMVFGRGGGGGLINRVTKGALAGETLVAGKAAIDSFGAAETAADINLPFSAAAVRFNGFLEHLANHRDAFSGDRFGINPVLGAEIGDSAKLQLGYEYLNDRRTVDRGVPSAQTGTVAAPAGPIKGFRDTFFGARGFNEARLEAHAVRFRGEAKLTPSLTLSAQGLYSSFDKVYANAFAATAPTAAGTVGFEAYRDPTKRNTLIGQTNLEWRGDTGGIGHILLLGAEFTDQDTANERINGFFDAANPNAANRRRFVPLADPVAIPPIFFVAGPAGNANRKVESALSQHSVYIQDQIALSGTVDVIAGVRYDRLKIAVANLFTGAVARRTDDLWSPRAGIVFKPSASSSIYLSYSRSFLPQSGDQFLTFDATNTTLAPETFDNYEIGAKWDIQPGLTLTTAVYRLDRGNTRAPGPVPGSIVLTGEQRSSGWELGLAGNVTPKWQTAIGYAYTKARISATTAAAPSGRPLAQVPRHQLSLWNRYQLSSGLGIGLGLYHQSAQFATISNVTRLPGYVRIDGALYLKLNPKLELQLNVENLTDTRYFPSAHNDNNITTGAPVNARLTLNARF